MLLLEIKTKYEIGYISTSLATWGSRWSSIEAKLIKDFDFLGFSLRFSPRIEQTSKNHSKMKNFGWILDRIEDCSILAEKQLLKPRISNYLMNFASLDAQLDTPPPPSCETSGVKWIWVRNPSVQKWVVLAQNTPISYYTEWFVQTGVATTVLYSYDFKVCLMVLRCLMVSIGYLWLLMVS